MHILKASAEPNSTTSHYESVRKCYSAPTRILKLFWELILRILSTTIHWPAVRVITKSKLLTFTFSVNWSLNIKQSTQGQYYSTLEFSPAKAKLSISVLLSSTKMLIIIIYFFAYIAATLQQSFPVALYQIQINIEIWIRFCVFYRLQSIFNENFAKLHVNIAKNLPASRAHFRSCALRIHLSLFLII